MKKPNPFTHQSIAFAALAKIWKKKVRQLAQELLTMKDPKRLAKIIDSELREAMQQYHVCKGLAKFAALMARRHKP